MHSFAQTPPHRLGALRETHVMMIHAHATAARLSRCVGAAETWSAGAAIERLVAFADAVEPLGGREMAERARRIAAELGGTPPTAERPH